jgi:hypothetical protein
MPIRIEEAKKYKGYTEDEVKVARFLERNRGSAFTEEEIRRGIGKIDIAYAPDERGSYFTLPNIGSFTINVLDRVFLRNTLEEMVKKNKIGVSEVSGERYYFTE